MRTRPPAAAGTFYPVEPATLAQTIDQLIDSVAVRGDERPAAAYVVPHAGYRYSGSFAAQAYARLRRDAALIRLVVLIGPAHRVPLRGCAVTGADRWRTPLGEVRVDRARCEALAAAGLVEIDDGPHRLEHSLEVQVPFLQRTLATTVPILPICIGESTTDEVAKTIAAATGTSTGDSEMGCEVAEGTVVLCSTDLSHYLPDDQARERDQHTADAVLALAPERIGGHDACGAFALRGLLHWARAAQLRPICLALGTSADTTGDHDQVVGYPAFSLLES